MFGDRPYQDHTYLMAYSSGSSHSFGNCSTSSLEYSSNLFGTRRGCSTVCDTFVRRSSGTVWKDMSIVYVKVLNYMYVNTHIKKCYVFQGKIIWFVIIWKQCSMYKAKKVPKKFKWVNFHLMFSLFPFVQKGERGKLWNEVESQLILTSFQLF